MEGRAREIARAEARLGLQQARKQGSINDYLQSLRQRGHVGLANMGLAVLPTDGTLGREPDKRRHQDQVNDWMAWLDWSVRFVRPSWETNVTTWNMGPPTANSNLTDDLVLWEETYADSSGKFRTKSRRGNYYFTEFVDAKTGDKIFTCHAKRKHFPIVYFTFINLIGRHLKVLYSDLASEMTGDDFERYLLVKGVNHITVPRGEHHSIGVAENAIQDLSNMMRSYLTNSNLPGIYWEYVVEQAALVNSMITPSIMDKVSVLRTPSEKLRTRSVRSFLDPFWGKKKENVTQ